MFTMMLPLRAERVRKPLFCVMIDYCDVYALNAGPLPSLLLLLLYVLLLQLTTSWACTSAWSMSTRIFIQRGFHWPWSCCSGDGFCVLYWTRFHDHSI